MSIHYIKQLIAQGEHQQLDFKFAINDSKKIARSLVAFANTDGGKLLVGVKDNGNIAGVRSEEEFYMLQAAAEMYSRPEIYFESRQWTIDGKTVLEITIPKSEVLPHKAVKENRWLAYVRVNDQNILANKIWVKAAELQKQNTGILVRYNKPQKLLINYLENNEHITLSKFCRIARLHRLRAENILIKFLALNIIEILFTEKSIFYKLNADYELPELSEPFEK